MLLYIYTIWLSLCSHSRWWIGSICTRCGRSERICTTCSSYVLGGNSPNQLLQEWRCPFWCAASCTDEANPSSTVRTKAQSYCGRCIAAQVWQFPLWHSWVSKDSDKRCKLPLWLSSGFPDVDTKSDDALFHSNALKKGSFSLTIMCHGSSSVLKWYVDFIGLLFHHIPLRRRQYFMAICNHWDGTNDYTHNVAVAGNG